MPFQQVIDQRIDHFQRCTNTHVEGEIKEGNRNEKEKIVSFIST
jgi:hypothetical protein